MIVVGGHLDLLMCDSLPLTRVIDNTSCKKADANLGVGHVICFNEYNVFTSN